MSRLYYSEQGRVMPSLCEELTTFRRARKHLNLPATEQPATVWLLVYSHPDNDTPLHLAVNGAEVDPINAQRHGAYYWHDVSVPASVLREGDNQFDLWAETTAYDGWTLALEAGHAAPGSALSDDAGQTWRSDHMSYLNNVLGEYVVRVRLGEGNDPAPDPVVVEDPSTPRVDALRQRLPAAALADAGTVERGRALSSWLANTWEHTSSGRAEQYAPWDAETLLRWGADRRGHNGKRPIAMCVHYAAAFVSAAQAAGMNARCAVTTEDTNGQAGHFVAELWVPELSKWIVVDPNTDAMFVRDGTPMSMTEIQSVGDELGQYIDYGPGSQYQLTFPHIVEFCDDNLSKGLCFRRRSVWHRADLLSQPWHSPPGHGSISYCETGLVWEERDRDRGFGMFPSFGTPDWFDAPPATRQ